MNRLKELKEAVRMIDSLIIKNHSNYDFYQSKKEKMLKEIEEIENEEQD